MRPYYEGLIIKYSFIDFFVNLKSDKKIEKLQQFYLLIFSFRLDWKAIL
jgi:hypothetical protein